MADEVVRYSFEGDSSRLQQATQQAIDSLTLYESTVQNITSVLGNLTSSINDVVDWVSLLRTEIQSMVGMMASSSNAISNLSTLSTELANALRAAADAMKQEQKASTDNAEVIEEESKALEDKKSGWSKMLQVINAVVAAQGRFHSPAKETVNVLREISDAASLAVSALKTYIGLDIASIFKNGAIAAMDYIENLNLFNVAMGDSLDYGKQFVSQMQEIYGLDPSNIMTYVGNFNQLASAIEMPARSAALVSTNMTKLATDMASLFNMDVADVISNMRSGIMGMTRAVSKYGLDIRTTTLQQTAWTLGITENVKNMTEANREGLRYITMVRQASNVSGDWAKTIESPSNQLRVLKEQLTQLARAIGNLFLPVITKVLPYVNGFVMALRTAVQAIADFFGFTDMDFGGTTSTIDKTTGSLEGVGEAADEAAEKVKALRAPFDELNVIQESDSDSTDLSGPSEMMDPAIVAAIEALNVPLENIKMKANEVRDALLKVFKLDGGKFRDTLDTIKRIIDNIKIAIGNIKDSFKNAFAVDDKGVKILGNLSRIVEGIFGWIEGISEILAEWTEGLDFGPLTEAFVALTDALANLVISLGNEFLTLFRDGILPLVEYFVENVLPNILKLVAGIIGYLSENPEILTTILAVVAAFLAIYKFVSLIVGAVQTISNIIDVIKVISGIIGISAGKLVLIVLGVVAAVAIVVSLVRDFIEHLDDIKSRIREVVDIWTNSSDGLGTKIANTLLWLVYVIDDIFTYLINKAIRFVNKVINVVNKIPGVSLGSIGEVTSLLPEEMTQVPYLASGGVVTGPTQTVVGEGRYDEAVIPLGNSPQLEDMLDRFADRVNNKPTDVNVYIGGKKWNAEVYNANQQGATQVGKNPLGSKVRV